MDTEKLYRVDPTRLSECRHHAHLACQWPTRAARANLEALPDDSHSNFGWNADQSALVSHALDPAVRYQAGFSFASGSLILLADGAIADSFPLEGKTDDDAGRWLDARLVQIGLNAASSAEMPYDLDGLGAYEFAADQQEITTLGAWFDAGFSVLTESAGEFEALAVVKPTVRCWPHHFDVGSLLALEGGDPESSRSIGIGLSPGDDSYQEPYFYCSPWPAPEAGRLPAPPAGFTWHTEGFTSMICTASSLRGNSEFTMLINAAVETSAKLLETTD